MSKEVQGTVVGSTEAGPGVNSNGQTCGASKYLSPSDAPRLVAEAELEKFAACAPCMQCCCCAGCTNEKVYARTYMRVYENRLEINNPCPICLCCTDEKCVRDNVQVYYFDKQPSRADMCFYCLPCTICGPPVVFSYVPKLCGCIDCRPCCGETIMANESNCFDCRTCICFGKPCYFICSRPMMGGIQNGEVFLAKWKAALLAYAERTGLQEGQVAVFHRVTDRFMDCDKLEHIEAATMER